MKSRVFGEKSKSLPNESTSDYRNCAFKALFADYNF